MGVTDFLTGLLEGDLVIDFLIDSALGTTGLRERSRVADLVADFFADVLISERWKS